ncbi:hypothetical protein [Actinomycetospora straminea]|uniref:Uncharacterized protein n=1 Tax=Actinomycetospora straminea TaxID=663607 RepID=A0ABP9FAF8_9PSEU|nr:hypothetical protein [Actinomycetospora straminea]MDD7936080.1 hypothetical protein [Actinomycetospora straminea]
MTTLAAPRVVHLDRPDPTGPDLGPVGGSRDLDALVDRARAAEAGGAAVVVIPPGGTGDHWPATARALAVLLATTSVRVVVAVDPAASEPDAIALFARSAAGLAGDRLIVQVRGAGAEAFAGALTARWDGPVVAGDADLAARA